MTNKKKWFNIVHVTKMCYRQIKKRTEQKGKCVMKMLEMFSEEMVAHEAKVDEFNKRLDKLREEAREEDKKIADILLQLAKESSPEEIKEFLNTSTEVNKYIVDDTKLAVCGVIFAHRENDTECVCLAEKFMEEYEATMAEKRKQDEEDLKKTD